MRAAATNYPVPAISPQTRRYPSGIILSNEVMAEQRGEITVLLDRLAEGDRSAEQDLFPQVYVELHRLAARRMRTERSGHTLQATALVHEAYMRLVGRSSVRFESRAHFFGIASHLMRQILVDHARRSHAVKRGGENVALVLDDEIALPDRRELSLTALDDALTALAHLD